jgi:hypothetical protein
MCWNPTIRRPTGLTRFYRREDIAKVQKSLIKRGCARDQVLDGVIAADHGRDEKATDGIGQTQWLATVV